MFDINPVIDEEERQQQLQLEKLTEYFKRIQKDIKRNDREKDLSITQISDKRREQGETIEIADNTSKYQKATLEDIILQKQKDVFHSFRGPPINFKPQTNSPLDTQIQSIIKTHDVRIPIQHIQSNFYLVGNQRTTLYMWRNLKGHKVMVKVGSDGHQRLDEYIVNNSDTLEKELIAQMMFHEQSLTWVTNEIIQGNRIKSPEKIMSHLSNRNLESLFYINQKQQAGKQMSPNFLERERAKKSYEIDAMVDKKGDGTYLDIKLRQNSSRLRISRQQRSDTKNEKPLFSPQKSPKCYSPVIFSKTHRNNNIFTQAHTQNIDNSNDGSSPQVVKLDPYGKHKKSPLRIPGYQTARY